MIPYGSKRTVGGCSTTKHRTGGKVHVIQYIKNKKFSRFSCKLELKML